MNPARHLHQSIKPRYQNLQPHLRPRLSKDGDGGLQASDLLPNILRVVAAERICAIISNIERVEGATHNSCSPDTQSATHVHANIGLRYAFPKPPKP